MLLNHRGYGLLVIFGGRFTQAGDAFVSLHLDKNLVPSRRVPARSGNAHKVGGNVRYLHYFLQFLWSSLVPDSDKTMLFQSGQDTLVQFINVFYRKGIRRIAGVTTISIG